MAIDPNWVRENPEEAARQIELLTIEREQYRAAEEAQIALREKMKERYSALEKAKLEALPADLKNRFLIIKMTGDIDRDNARYVMKGMGKYSHGVGIFVNQQVDIETVDMKQRDALKQAEALSALAERKEKEAESEDDAGLKSKCAYAAVCAANESNRLRRIAQGGA